MILMFHGLSAYNGAKNPLAVIKAVETCMDAEIAVADRPIGAILIEVEGTDRINDLYPVYNDKYENWSAK